MNRLLILSLVMACIAGAQEPGEALRGASGIQATTAQIMAWDRIRNLHPQGRHPAPRYLAPSASWLGSTGEFASVAATAASLSAQTVSPTLNFTAANFNDCSGWPPDTMGAVGPTQFVIALNGRIRSFNKATGVADGGIDTGTDSFFSSVMTPGLNFTTDPRIRYDRLSGRWFVTMIDVPGQQGKQPNRVMIAMSDSGTITGGTVWTFFQFRGDASNFADYPTLGIDANALYIGANIFSVSSGSLVNTTGFVVRKSSLLSGGPMVVTPFTGLIATSGHPPRSAGPFTPQGVDNFDPAATEGYFIGVDINSSASTLQLRRVSNPGSTPSLSGNVSISVNSFASPINVTVQGTSGTVDGLDRRLLAAHFRNGSLWTSHNVGVNSSGGTSSPDRNGSRWYQITGIPTGQTPSVVQSGTVFQSGASNASYWMGTIMVSGQGHAAMGFTKAGPNNFLDAATTGRLVGDASGTMGAPVTYTASASAYNPSDGSNPHRWGDYSFTSLDPSDDMTMWTVQEWCQSPGNGYAVQVAQLLAPPPAFPTNCTPAIVTQGVASVSVVVKGSPTNGAGFFDPGTNFPNHIRAVVIGSGVTVNSTTYNNPTNVTLNLTVASNAAPGLRAITIFNPDDQRTTSASGILTIASSSSSPLASFSAGPTNGQAPLTVSFTNLSTGATNYSWNFGDGHTSTNANPANTYTNAGSYTVSLSAIGAAGTNTLTRTNYVLVTNPLPPVANFIANPTTGAAPLTVFFTNLSSAAANYLWDFGDGKSSTNVNPVSTYTNAGSYTVSLRAVGVGGTNTLTRTNYVLVTNPPPPVVADFSANPTNGAAPLLVSFTNLSTGASSYSWDFGDGHTSLAANPANTYSNAGSFTVKLTAVGPGGTNTLARTNFVVVSNLPPPVIADFRGSPTSGVAPLTVTFTNLSTGAASYGWDFGDGHSATNTDPSHTYTNAGSYSVGLAAIGADGTNLLTRTNYITVIAPPQLVVSPGSLDFGLLATGATAQANLVVSNAGEATLSGSASVSPGAFAVASGSPFNLVASGSTNLLLSFTPPGEGVFSSVVVFASNGGDSTNALLGRALNPPLLLSPVFSGSAFTFSFASVLGFTYDVQYKDSLDDPLWQTLQSAPGNGSVLSITNMPPTPAQRFYRLSVQ